MDGPCKNLPTYVNQYTMRANPQPFDNNLDQATDMGAGTENESGL